MEAMESFQRYVDSDPEIGYSFSLADIVKSINMVFYDAQPRWGVIPEQIGRIANLFFFYFAGAPPSETSKYLDPSYTMAHVTFFCRNHQGDTVARIIDRCRAYVQKFPNNKVDFRLAGGLIGVTAAANEEILKNDILMNILGFGTIFFVLLFTYRSFVAGIIMLIPLFLANGVINAYIGFRHFGINLQSLPVVTVGVGFGIDYGLYIVSRAIEEYRDHLRFREGGTARNADRREGGDVHRGVAGGIDAGLGVLEHPLQLGDGSAAVPVDDDQLPVDDDAAAGVDGHHAAEVHDPAGEARGRGRSEGRGDRHQSVIEQSRRDRRKKTRREAAQSGRLPLLFSGALVTFVLGAVAASCAPDRQAGAGPTRGGATNARRVLFPVDRQEPVELPSAGFRPEAHVSDEGPRLWPAVRRGGAT